MNKNTASFPTDSGGAGTSIPVFTKGIVCRTDLARIREAPSAMSKPILGVVKGTELEVLEEVKGFYKVRLFGNDHPALVGYIPSHFVKEARNDGK